MVAKKLSTFLKKKYKPIIEERDGKDCFYCGKPFRSTIDDLFSPDKRLKQVFDHLNNDDSWNDEINLVLAHSICNEQKKSNSEWIIKAKQKLRDNQRSARIPESHMDSMKDTETETETNAVFAEIVLNELNRKLQSIEGNAPKKSYLILGDFLDVVTAKGYKEVGHASQNTMRRIVKMFCTTEFPFICEKDKDLRKFIIRLRDDDEYEN